MEFFHRSTHWSFMNRRHLAFAFSTLLMIISITALCLRGLDLGLDFTGGSQVELHFDHAADVGQIHDWFEDMGYAENQVQSYGSSRQFIVRIPCKYPINAPDLQNQISQHMETEVARIDTIGPQVGEAMMINSVIAIVLALVATMIYIALRFDYRFALSAALALVHDPVLILGIWALFGLNFDLIALAALLTVLGYSLNDTIVVYDRIRENFREHRDQPVVDIIDLSINQTLSRTLITSSLTLAVVLCLLFLGGETLFSFSLALAIGIVIGTYSSIYIAGAVAMQLGLSPDAFKRKKRTTTPL